MSRRASVGVPIGVAAAVIAAVFLGVVLRDDGGRPAPLPLSLAASGRSGAESATADAKMAAGAPTAGSTSYRFVGAVPADLPDEAKVYQLEDGAPAKADVRRLADALGLSGDITSEEGALVVRDGEWVLRVSTSASRMWSFYREVKPVCEPLPAGAEPALSDEYAKRGCGQSTPGSDSGEGAAGICQAGVESPCNDTPETKPDETTADPAPDSASGSGTTSSGGGSSGSAGTAVAPPPPNAADQPVMSCPEPAPCPPDTKCAAVACAPYEEPKPLPLGSESDARRTAQKVFDAAGIGNGATIRVDRGYDAWFISATVHVAGLEVVGLGHSVSVDADGKVRDASGTLAVEKVLDTYPLITPQAGLDRLEKQYGDIRIMIDCAPPAPGSEATTTSCGPPMEPQVLDVTGVRLGLLFSPIWDNEKETVFLVPAWVYEIKGRDYPESIMAIPDEYLTTVAPPQPSDGVVVDPGVPEPAPGQVDPAAPTEPKPDAPVAPESAQSEPRPTSS